MKGEIASLDHKLKWIMRAKDTDATLARRDISTLLSLVILWGKESQKDLSEYYSFDRNPAEEDAERMCGKINPQKKRMHDDSTILKSPPGGNHPQRGTSVIQNKTTITKETIPGSERSHYQKSFFHIQKFKRAA